MDYSRMIHDYLDGELDQMQQDLLFAELATNQDLRFDFNQQVKLQVIAQSDMALISPPLEATNAIFSTLGFSIPSEEYLKNLVGDTVATSPITSIKRFWAKHFALNVILLLILLTSGTMLVLNPDILNTNGSGKTAVSIESGANKTDGNNLSGMTSVPVVRSFADISDNSSSNADNGSVVRHSNRHQRSNNIFGINTASVNQSNNSANTIDISNEENFSSDNINNRHNLFSDEELLSDASQDINLTNSASKRVNSSLATNSNILVNPIQSKQEFYNNFGPTGYNVNPFSLVSVDNSNWTIQVRKLALSPAQKNDLSQSFDRQEQNTWNSNLAFSAMYKTNPFWSFGIELGWEAFNQAFTFTDENGQTKSQRQSPQLMWYGVTSKLNMSDFLWDNVVYPYAQSTLAWTSVGPVIRGQAGLTIQPVGLFRFNIGYEISDLIYYVEPTVHGSLNYGLTFGGSVNF
jgi:hypothetical protein